MIKGLWRTDPPGWSPISISALSCYLTVSGVSWGICTKVHGGTQRAEDLEWLHEPESIIGEGHVGNNLSRFDKFEITCLKRCTTSFSTEGGTFPISLHRMYPKTLR